MKKWKLGDQGRALYACESRTIGVSLNFVNLPFLSYENNLDNK